MDEQVFLNGQLIPAEQARLSVFDVGFLHGAGLFETMRAYAGRVYRLDEHLDRMLDSAGKLLISVAGDKAYLRQAVEKTLQANGCTEARIRLTVSRGDLRVDARGKQGGTVLVTCSVLTPYPAEYYQKGMSVVVSSARLNSSDPIARHKSTNYLSKLLVLHHAHQQGAGEALWFTEQDHLGEGCVANVFLVRDGKLLTPPLSEPILPGITRAAVLELAQKQDIPVAEQVLLKEDMDAAQEIFLTNSIMEIMPVCRLNKQAVGDDRPGELTRRLAEIYRQDVAKKV